MLRIGLVSDTHGLLRPEARAFLAGSDHIVHAGDIGDEAILSSLATLAPLTVVRGNNDRGEWAARLRDSECLEAGGIRVYAIHDLAELEIDPVQTRIDVVVSGHSHRPQVQACDDVLHVNPGSAGPRRFRLPIAAGELLVDGGRIRVRIVDLETGRTL